MKQLFVLLAFTAIGATGLLAQQHAADGDKMMAGGALPAGWSVRLDNGSTKPDGVSVMPMGGGMHFKSGPAGVYYRTADAKSGSYDVHASFNQVEPSEHPEGYGLIIGGADLAGAGQKYTYFLVRQDGKFMVSRRAGAKVNSVAAWTDSPAIKKTEGTTKGTNMLSIVVAPDRTRFLVNGTEVLAQPTANIDASGIAGLRINHNLNVHVDGFGVK